MRPRSSKMMMPSRADSRMAVLNASLSCKASSVRPPVVAVLLLLQGVRHRLPQPGQPVLEQVVGGALPEALDGGLVAEGAGDDDDGVSPGSRLPHHRVQHLQGVELGQVIVGQDDIGSGARAD